MSNKSAMASRPGRFVATLLACCFIMAEAHVASHHSYINYTTLTGFFLQDDPTTNASTFDYVSAPKEASPRCSTPHGMMGLRPADSDSIDRRK